MGMEIQNLKEYCYHAYIENRNNISYTTQGLIKKIPTSIKNSKYLKSQEGPFAKKKKVISQWVYLLFEV